MAENLPLGADTLADHPGTLLAALWPVRSTSGKLLCGGLLTLLPTMVPSVAASQSIYEIQHFIHTPEEMLEFDSEAFLRAFSPALAGHASTIEHWAGRTTISPRVLLALMELESSILTKARSGVFFDVTRPFGVLSIEDSFQAQTQDIAERLGVEFYDAYYGGDREEAARLALSAVLGAQPAGALSRVYSALFRAGSGPTSPASPPLGVMGGFDEGPGFSLPFRVGETWAGGGAHSYDDDRGYYTALDFWGVYQDWNEDTSPHLVAASTSGIISRRSDCGLIVVGPDGWTTGYYHLENILVADGEQVVRGQPIANYANTLNEALCEGGASSGPHIHFWITKDGVAQSMENRVLSTFTVHPGRSNYDTDCDFSWFERPDGSKVCPNYRELLNEGVPASFTTRCQDLSCSFEHVSSPDDGVVTDWSWDFGDGANGAGPTATHEYSDDGSYRVTLTLTNEQGLQRSAAETIVIVGNKAPQLNLIERTQLRARELPAELELEATIMDDGLPQQPGSVTASWTRDSGPAEVSFVDASEPRTTVQFTQAGEYVLTLTADDGRLVTEASITVVVSLNAAPNADAGKDQNVSLGDTVMLDGSASDDSDGTISQYTWTQLEGPMVTIAEANSATGSFLADEVGTIKLQLEVLDNDGATSVDEVLVFVIGPGFEGPVTGLEKEKDVEMAVSGGGCQCVPAPLSGGGFLIPSLLLLGWELIRRRSFKRRARAEK